MENLESIRDFIIKVAIDMNININYIGLDYYTKSLRVEFYEENKEKDMLFKRKIYKYLYNGHKVKPIISNLLKGPKADNEDLRGNKLDGSKSKYLSNLRDMKEKQLSFI